MFLATGRASSSARCIIAAATRRITPSSCNTIAASNHLLLRPNTPSLSQTFRHLSIKEVPTPKNPKDIIAKNPPDAAYPTDIPVDEEELYEQEIRDRYVPGSGMRKRPLRVSYNEQDFEDEYTNAFKWTLRHKRCGAVGIKLGMMPVWDEWGVRHPCTVLYLDSNVVLRVKSHKGKDGYDAVQLGAGEYKKKNVNKPMMGYYKSCGVDEHPPYTVREFRISHVEGKTVAPEQGSRIHARHFLAGQNVDVAGISKGKGFQGAMKRHGFGGMPATHGTSKSHRALGSTGQCQDPGKVFKGKKMAGRMGAERVTTQNLRVVKIDRGRNLLYLRGHVPGQRGGFVEIRDAVKNPLFGTDLCEGGAEESQIPPLPTFEYEEGVDGCGEGGFEVMKPREHTDPDMPAEAA